MENIEPFHKKLDHLVIRALVSLSKDCALKSWASQSTGWYPGNGFCILGLIDIVKFLSFLGVKIVCKLTPFRYTNSTFTGQCGSTRRAGAHGGDVPHIIHTQNGLEELITCILTRTLGRLYLNHAIR